LAIQNIPFAQTTQLIVARLIFLKEQLYNDTSILRRYLGRKTFCFYLL